jgi:hypothetical protein
MNTTDGIWVPSYYRRRHPFLWLRAAGGPQTEDWVAGAVVAALVLLALVRTPNHEVAPSAAVAEAATTAAQAQDGSVISADRVAYAPQPSAVDK